MFIARYGYLYLIGLGKSIYHRIFSEFLRISKVWPADTVEFPAFQFITVLVMKQVFNVGFVVFPF